MLIHCGERVYFAKGTTSNIKITQKEDIALFEALLKVPEELLYSISNPPHEYYLPYVDGTVETYTRANYSSSLELQSGVGGPWKFPGYLLKRYHEFGIEYI